MPREIEPNVNNALGVLLKGMMSSSQVRSENTQVIAGQPSLHPDILVTATERSPVAIEAEYMPAANVEAEARGRLGLEAVEGGRIIEATIALRYPEDIGDADDLGVAKPKSMICLPSVDSSPKPLLRTAHHLILKSNLDAT